MKKTKPKSTGKGPMTRTGNLASKGAKSAKGQSAVKKNYKEKKYTNNDN